MRFHRTILGTRLSPGLPLTSAEMSKDLGMKPCTRGWVAGGAAACCRLLNTHVKMSLKSPLDATSSEWSRLDAGKGLRGFSCFLPVLVIWFCNVEALAHPLSLPGHHCCSHARSPAWVWFEFSLQKPDGGVRGSVSGRLCPLHGASPRTCFPPHPCAKPSAP